jgi:glucose/mannose transport system permease protein
MRATRWGKAAVAAVVALAVACLFLSPLYVMLVTSFKSMEEIRGGALFALPTHISFEPWHLAWSGACTGVECGGIRGGFWNSVLITVPSTVLAVLLGALNGYALSIWRPRGGEALFGVLLLGAFIPVQVMMFPLVRLLGTLGLVGTLTGIVLVHVIFSMPLMTLLFRNFFRALPAELFHAARIDGARFARMFFHLGLPLARPMLVIAAILQLTGVWNDYILGLVFAGRTYQPMMVELNNLINTTTGTRFYNVDMAATLLTAALPLLVYACAGRWFVRGVTAGALRD